MADEIQGILEKTTHPRRVRDVLQVTCSFDGTPCRTWKKGQDLDNATDPTVMSGPTAVFRLSGGRDLMLTIALHHGSASPLARRTSRSGSCKTLDRRRGARRGS
ncbi:MAG: hypothetical protein U0835_22480 [Isosphaeraceae bacterium]